MNHITISLVAFACAFGGHWPETGFSEITPDKSASVYDCFSFICPYNALSA